MSMIFKADVHNRIAHACDCREVTAELDID